MAITKADKVRLVEHYKKNEEWVKTVSILKQFAIPVNEINAVRRTLAKVDCKLSVVKKRIFLSQMKELWYGDVDLDTLEGSVVILYSYWDEFAWLKVIENVRKGWKKAKAKYEIDYVWGWFGKEWKDGEYVNSLAVLPSKEELVAKLLYLMTYPIQSFVMALDQIKQKQEWGDSSQS